VEAFRDYFGPTRNLFDQLDAERQAGLAKDLAEVFRAGNRATDGTLAIAFEYLELVARKG
jgi:hypothetical protein